MMSSVIDGKVYDWRWKRRQVDTLLYIGDTMVGQIFKMRRGWSTVHRLPSTTGGPVCGFRSRMDASQYLSQLEEMHRKKQS